MTRVMIRIAWIAMSCNTVIVPLRAQQPKVSGVARSVSVVLDTLVPQLLQKYSEPGLVVAMVDGCQPAFARGFGLADKARTRRAESSTVFQMGSISKTLAAWGVLRLVEAGRVDLDAPVDRYLKRWHLPADSNAVKVTVRRLLSHTAGISLPSVGGVNAGEPLPTLLDELEGRGSSAGTGPVSVTSLPGTKYEYSGGGYAILQLLIEDVSGKPFARYMHDEVFAPLRMSHTTFGWSGDVAATVATPYSDKDGSALPHRLYSALGAAGLYSTADDMSKFLMAHCTRESVAPGARVIHPETLAAMMRAAEQAPRYGLGYEVMPSLGPIGIVGHSGSNPGWKTNFMMLPSVGVGIVVMTNTDGGRARMDVLRVFRDAVLKAYAPSKP
jgi:CubicO group peptidase (beta-lactamase class C family)